MLFRLLCLWLFLLPAPAQAFVYTQYIIYKSAAHPVSTSSDAAWSEIGGAYSASTIPMPFDDMKAAGAAIRSARIFASWKAGSLQYDTGVEMLACPPQHAAQRGLVGCTVLAMYAANDTRGPVSYATKGCVSNPGGPFPCQSDVTAVFRGLIAAGVPLYLTVATYGNGNNGPLLYDAELLVEWSD